LPKFQTVAKIPNRCQNPKSLPKSQIVAKIQNRCQNPKPLPKSQIIAKIPNCCQNPKLLLKSQTVAEVQIAAKILLNLGFWQQFRILATVWDFSNSLGF
jgi:hypothetical protein